MAGKTPSGNVPIVHELGDRVVKNQDAAAIGEGESRPGCQIDLGDYSAGPGDAQDIVDSIHEVGDDIVPECALELESVGARSAGQDVVQRVPGQNIQSEFAADDVFDVEQRVALGMASGGETCLQVDDDTSVR